jgi:hypothetical protein
MVSLKSIQHRYSHGEARPLAGYVAAMGGYTALVAGLTLIGRAKGVRMPRLGLTDVILAGVATQKLSRIISKGTITSPLRAPFTTFKGPAGASELDEEVTGEGVSHAIGELVTCPFCVAVWLGTAFTAGYAFFPQLTRAVTTTFGLVGIADLLQLEYGKAKE